MKHIIVFLSFCLTVILATPLQNGPQKTYLKDVGSRIVNGTQAKKGQFPWQVALFVQGDFSWFCGGSIISKEWILTAGHCVDGATSARVYAGIVEIQDSAVQVAQGIEFIKRDDFDLETAHNDIGLIKLEEPLEFNENVQAIDLSDTPLEEDIEVTVSGWGLLGDDYLTISNILNYVKLQTITNDQCQDIFKNDVITEEMVCATSEPNQKRGPCSGDSGGPVVTNVEDNPQLVAVVSFVSDNGCESAEPSGYARVAYFRDWIKKNSGI